MASKRHGRVTRWFTITKYSVTMLTTAGRRTEEMEDVDGMTPAELEAMTRLQLHAKNAVLLDFTILERRRVLYGMKNRKFIADAEILETAPAE